MTQKSVVLVVEDDWVLADQLASCMQGLGLDVLGPVANAGLALDLLRTTKPALALLCHKLRSGSSEPVAQALTAGGIPFIVVTGRPAESLPPHLQERPILEKPVDDGELCAMVQSLLRLPGIPPGG